MSSDLRYGGRAHNHVLMHLVEAPQQRLRCTRIANAPAGHRIAFGEPAQQDGAITQAAHRRHANVPSLVCFAVDQPIIDLVGDHKQVVFLNQRGDVFKRLTSQHRARWVVRIAQKKRLRVGRNVGFESFGSHLKVVLNACGHVYDGALCKARCGRIRHKAGLWNEDFVAGIQNGEHGCLHRLAHAHGGKHLRLHVVRHAISILQIGYDRLAKVLASGVGGVTCGAVVERVDTGLHSGLRRHEVGLTNAQRDHIIHGGGNLKEAPDSAGRRGANTFGEIGFQVGGNGSIRHKRAAARFGKAQSM